MAEPEPVAPEEITLVLEKLGRGEAAAGDLVDLVYDQLRELARGLHAKLRPGQTLQPTALVNEMWLRVLGGRACEWSGRAHFFGAAAKAMRNIMIDAARARASLKRGGDRQRVTGPMDFAIEQPTDDVLELSTLLDELEAEDERKARVVSLRYFTGLELEEIAEVLDVSVPTVKRDWRFARAWLQRRLRTE